MIDVKIPEAIALYKFSNTAAGVAPGDVGPRARRVARKLDELYRADEVGWASFWVNDDWEGDYVRGRRGYDIQIRRQYIRSLLPDERLAALSLVLVHEAGHAAHQRKSNLVEEEVEVRTLEVYYFRELSGPGVFNEVSDRLYRIRPGALLDAKEQSDYEKRDQLVDYVVDLYSDSLTADWIEANDDEWGGLVNRWPKTRSRYINVLAQDPDPASAGLILDILETSGHLPASQQLADFAEMIRHVDIDDVRGALTKEYARDKDSAARIEALQRKWFLKLVYPGHR